MSLRTTHILAVVGAVVVFVATAVTWYTHDVSVGTQTGQVAYSSSKSYTLWDLTTLAPVLLVIGAALGAALLLFAPSSSARAAAAGAGLLGLGITAYCVVKCFDFPDLGQTGAVSVPLPGGAVGASASTVLNAGPFVGILGGLLFVASAVGHTSDAAGTAPGGPNSSRKNSPVQPEPGAPKITKNG
jgi:hypothetical protein